MPTLSSLVFAVAAAAGATAPPPAAATVETAAATDTLAALAVCRPCGSPRWISFGPLGKSHNEKPRDNPVVDRQDVRVAATTAVASANATARPRYAGRRGGLDDIPLYMVFVTRKEKERHKEKQQSHTNNHRSASLILSCLCQGVP